MAESGGDLGALVTQILGAGKSIDVLADLDPQTRSGSTISDALGSLTSLADERLRLRCIIHWPALPALRERVRADVFGEEIGRHGWFTRSLATIPSVDLLIIDGRLVHRWRHMPSGASYVMVTDSATTQFFLEYFDALWSDPVSPSPATLLYEDVVALSRHECNSVLVGLGHDVWDQIIAELASDPCRLLRLDPRRFEELVAELLVRDGMEVQLTRASRDGGRDILASCRRPTGNHLFLVECKRYSPARPIGVGIVRALYGVVEQERATAGLLVTTSRFTTDAKAFVAPLKYRMSLTDYEQLVEWIGRCLGRRGG